MVGTEPRDLLYSIQLDSGNGNIVVADTSGKGCIIDGLRMVQGARAQICRFDLPEV